MWRIRTLLGLLSLVTLSACALISDPASESQRPNILIILLDDMGYSDVGAFGSEINTPSMDALAANGRTFSQFYVHPRCSPTRASLMTGMYPHQVGLGVLALPAQAGMPSGPYQGYLDEDAPSLPQALKSAGYKTYMSGKWHLGEEPEHWPRQFGFDRYFGLISGASSYYELILDQPMVRRMALDDTAWTPPSSGFFMTDATTDYALNVLRDHARTDEQAPFFLYVAYTAPHWPLHAAEADIQAYSETYDDGWEPIIEARAETLRSHDPSVSFDLSFAKDQLGAWSDYQNKDAWIRNMQTHAAMITAADRGIGKIVEALRTSGDLENTLILILSDNGASAEDVSARGLHDPTKRAGERGSYLSYGPQGAAVSNSPLRDFKGTVYDGGVRSPLIAHWPDQISAGARDQQSVFGVMDLPSTVLSLALGSAPQDMEGQDLSQALLGQESATRPLYWEHVGWRGVRDGDLKAVSAPGESEWQLYDLSIDPSEANDIAGDNAEEVARLSADWEAWSRRVGADPIPMETLMKLFGQSGH